MKLSSGLIRTVPLNPGWGPPSLTVSQAGLGLQCYLKEGRLPQAS